MPRGSRRSHRVRNGAHLENRRRLQRQIDRYALQRWLCRDCGRPMEHHRDGFECRAWSWWLSEPGVFTDPLVRD